MFGIEVADAREEAPELRAQSGRKRGCLDKRLFDFGNGFTILERERCRKRCEELVIDIRAENQFGLVDCQSLGYWPCLATVRIPLNHVIVRILAKIPGLPLEYDTDGGIKRRIAGCIGSRSGRPCTCLLSGVVSLLRILLCNS